MEMDMKMKLASLKKRKVELNDALSKNADYCERVEINKQIKELVDLLTGAKEDIKPKEDFDYKKKKISDKIAKKAKQPIPPPKVA